MCKGESGGEDGEDDNKHKGLHIEGKSDKLGECAFCCLISNLSPVL